jgi:mono/diheme cytochrome c family protein
MPKVFAGEPGKIDQRAADLAAFFVSLGAPPEEKPLDETLVPQGGALFANLGCIACHTKPDADGQDEFARVPLAHIRAKWHAPALTDFLKDPAKNYAWNRMPHFRLNDDEAAKLTAYLFLTAKAEMPSGPKGDATRGGQLLATSNCLNCHAGVPPTTTPTLAATLKNGWSKGCLAADPAARGKAPDFGFTPAQRDALLAFAALDWSSLKQDAFPEFAERQIKNLRCTACHARDGQQSVWSQLEDEIVALQSGAPLEEGEGKPIHTTALPDLTWIGEKLRPDYLATFIAGHAKDKPRPWIVARMPGFAAYAEPLAKGLGLGTGFDKPLPASPPDAEKVKAGETLIGENGGFNCIQCHTLGDRPATAVFEAPGPNLALTPLRLRAEYFHRWVLAPTRIDPETKMPRFADEAGKTPLTDFFGGKADEQFDAIWQYLQTLRK